MYENDILSKVEKNQGWRVERSSGVSVLRKVWTTTVYHATDPALGHEAGTFKRSWQVIADAGLLNYEIRSHRVYRVRVIFT